MKLRNKLTDEIIDLSKGSIKETCFGTKIQLQVTDRHNKPIWVYNSLAELNEVWEDYEAPKEYICVLPNRVRRVIFAWVKGQDNPIEKISILLKSYDTNEVDSDGLYDYEFYGYVSNNNKNLVANTLSIRLKKPFKFDEYRDYTLPELGIFRR